MALKTWHRTLDYSTTGASMMVHPCGWPPRLRLNLLRKRASNALLGPAIRRRPSLFAPPTPHIRPSPPRGRRSRGPGRRQAPKGPGFGKHIAQFAPGYHQNNYACRQYGHAGVHARQSLVRWPDINYASARFLSQQSPPSTGQSRTSIKSRTGKQEASSAFPAVQPLAARHRHCHRHYHYILLPLPTANPFVLLPALTTAPVVVGQIGQDVYNQAVECMHVHKPKQQ